MKISEVPSSVSSIFYVVSHMTPFLADPDKDFTRRRKLPPETLISFLVSQGASSTGNELDDFFDFLKYDDRDSS